MQRFCSLGRHYTTPGRPLTIGIKPGLFSEHRRLAVIGPATEEPLLRGDAQLTFDGTAPIRASFFEHIAKAMGARGTIIDLTEADLAPLETAKEVRIQAGKLDVILALDSVPDALKSLDVCQKELLVSWGMEPKVVATIATWPKAQGTTFSHKDYPAVAMRKKEHGTTDVRYWVSKEGKVHDCYVVESSGSSALDAQTCAIITKRGRYEPARTKNGEAVDSISFSRVRWELPL